MSVYDKELIINGKAVRSPEQQVYKNMKDIEALQEVIKPEYNTTAELTDSSVSVALSTTNAPAGTTEGWIITQDGLKFKITGGDETNLLLEFYSDLKGPQGEQGPSGADLEIDDSGTSATKVWSSQKVSQELANAGQQLHQHNISVYGNSISYTFRLNPIMLESDEEITTLHELWTLLNAKGFCASDTNITTDVAEARAHYIGITGRVSGSNGYGLIASSSSVDVFYYQTGSGSAGLNTSDHSNVKDIVD